MRFIMINPRISQKCRNVNNDDLKCPYKNLSIINSPTMQTYTINFNFTNFNDINNEKIFIITSKLLQ